jgi:hypothetical protein
MEREKRKAKRIGFFCEVECMGADITCLRTRINDLSTEGVFVDSMTCFTVGSVLNLRFYINDVLIETAGEVRYSMPQIGMGVRFIDLSPEHKALIESLVEGKPATRSEPAGDSSTDQAAAAPPPASNVLSGNFAVVSLFDVVQMIDHGHLTGTLSVRLPSTVGEIRFNNGRIVGAAAGLLTGESALNRLLGATEGSFEFQKSNQEFENTIQAESNTALLLDLLRVKDEEKTVS